MLQTVNDLECRYFCLAESTIKSPDENFLQFFTNPVEEQIFSDFPEDLWTPTYMEQAHIHSGRQCDERTQEVLAHHPERIILVATPSDGTNCKVEV